MVIAELKWHCRWISMAAQYASWSKDESTKVGAVIVRDKRQLTAGFNGFPQGINDHDPKKWKRPDKYLYIEHAERNALNQAALHGISVEGATLYLPYSPPPCDSCTRGIIQTRIARVIGPTNSFPGKGDQWQRSMEIANEMLFDAGIDVYRIPGNWLSEDEQGNPIFDNEMVYSNRFVHKALGQVSSEIRQRCLVIDQLSRDSEGRYVWKKVKVLDMEETFYDFD